MIIEIESHVENTFVHVTLQRMTCQFTLSSDAGAV